MTKQEEKEAELERQKALAEIKFLRRNGHQPTPLLLQKAFGRIQFASAGATRRK